jgi:hypothetical protein
MKGHWHVKVETPKADNQPPGRLPFAVSSYRLPRYHGCSLCICWLSLALAKSGGPSCCTADNLAGCVNHVAMLPSKILGFARCLDRRSNLLAPATISGVVSGCCNDLESCGALEAGHRCRGSGFICLVVRHFHAAPPVRLASHASASETRMRVDAPILIVRSRPAARCL